MGLTQHHACIGIFKTKLFFLNSEGKSTARISIGLLEIIQTSFLGQIKEKMYVIRKDCSKYFTDGLGCALALTLHSPCYIDVFLELVVSE